MLAKLVAYFAFDISNTHISDWETIDLFRETPLGLPTHIAFHRKYYVDPTHLCIKTDAKYLEIFHICNETT
jgi:hypothetical protein